MKESFYLTLTRVVLILETVNHRHDIRAVLESAGFGALQGEGEELVERAREAVVEILEEIQPDSTVIHLVHIAATELEQWLESARFRARGLHEPEKGILGGHDIHHADHTLSVMAQALRFATIARQSQECRAAIGGDRSTEDLLQRGNALLVKLLRLANGAIEPPARLEEARSLTGPLGEELGEWLRRVSAIAERSLGRSPIQYGALGLLSAGAVPVGGAAGNVVRHERTRRQAPLDGPSPADPGWSIGRQGRNRLNVGRGFHCWVFWGGGAFLWGAAGSVGWAAGSVGWAATRAAHTEFIVVTGVWLYKR